MHKLLHFKGFENAEIDLFSPVTLLIGRNGAGKTNLIEGIELMAQLANGRPLGEIVDTGRAGDFGFGIRGGLSVCCHGAMDGTPRVSDTFNLPKKHSASSFTLCFNGANVQFDGASYALDYKLEIECLKAPHIKSESLQIGDRKFFDANGDSTGIMSVKFDNFKKGGIKPTTQLSADRTVLARYGQLLAQLDPKKSTKALATVETIQNYLRRAYIFDPRPQAMRDYQRIGQTTLDRSGTNLSSVLHSLSVGTQKNQDALERILEQIRQLPEEEFETFEFTEVKRLHDVILGFKLYGTNELVDARLLSDGTLRALAILTAIETAPPGSRVVIEELDNGIHSSRLGKLMEVIWAGSKNRNLNILASTHNPATLNALTSEQLKSVIVCHYDKKSRASKLTRLTNIAEIESLLERGPLGDLVTKQVLEKHLLPNFKSEQKTKALKWLERLQ